MQAPPELQIVGVSGTPDFVHIPKWNPQALQVIFPPDYLQVKLHLTAARLYFRCPTVLQEGGLHRLHSSRHCAVSDQKSSQGETGSTQPMQVAQSSTRTIRLFAVFDNFGTTDNIGMVCLHHTPDRHHTDQFKTRKPP